MIIYQSIENLTHYNDVCRKVI